MGILRCTGFLGPDGMQGACSSPERFQLDLRLIHPLQSLETEELFLVKSLLVFEHEVDGPPEFVSEDREGLGFTMLMGQPEEILFTGLIAFKEKGRLPQRKPT